MAVPPDDDRVRCVQLGDAGVLDQHPGEVRAAEPQENLPLSMRLLVGCLIVGGGLKDVRRDGMYVALWRSGADAHRRELQMRPLTPQALGSHKVLVAMHPEGMEVVVGEDGTDRRLLAVDSAVLVPTSSSYRFVSRGGDPGLLVLVGFGPVPTSALPTRPIERGRGTLMHPNRRRLAAPAPLQREHRP